MDSWNLHHPIDGGTQQVPGESRGSGISEDEAGLEG
jgi:hypothetical protein